MRAVEQHVPRNRHEPDISTGRVRHPKGVSAISYNRITPFFVVCALKERKAGLFVCTRCHEQDVRTIWGGEAFKLGKITNIDWRAPHIEGIGRGPSIDPHPSIGFIQTKEPG